MGGSRRRAALWLLWLALAVLVIALALGLGLLFAIIGAVTG